MTEAGQVTVGGRLVITLIVMEHNDCCPVLSVAEKRTILEPDCAAVGVQLKVLLTPDPPVSGKAGLIVAPAGNPAVLRVTKAFASGSVPVSVNETDVPAGTVSGPAGLIAHCGGLPICGTIFSRKSTGILLLILPLESKSSMTIWVVQNLVWLRPEVFQVTKPVEELTVRFGG
jgi:hypothetical protein